MGSSTKIDVNYLSVGSQDGQNVWTLFAGSSAVQFTTFPEDGNITPDNPTQYASVLKLADNANVVLNDIKVSQGNECAVDINNHVIASIKGVFGSDGSTGNQIFSIKGGSKASIRGIIKGDGNRLGADILVDNWSDQSYSGSIVDLAVIHFSGRKAKVVKRFFASKVTGSYETLYWASFKLTFYWCLKWLTRKILKIKLGQKGPSWL